MTTARTKIMTPSRILQCRELPNKRMKNRQIEILLNVEPIINNGCPRKSNSSARDESGMELSSTLKIVPVRATIWTRRRESAYEFVAGKIGT